MTERIKEIDILWITGGLGCDGDTIAMTGATQPSIEDLVLGGIPGIPKVHFHNPLLAYEVGEDFMKFFHDAAAGRNEPFILVIEGSIPDEENKAEATGRDMAPTNRPASPLRSVNGSTGSRPKRGRSSP